MASEKGKAFAKKMLDTHELFIQNEWLHCNSCFDTNGKKSELLTRTQLRLLVIIKALGKASISKLCTIVQTSKSSLSITTNRLAVEGYLKKVNDKKDGRIVYFSITSKGRAIMDKTVEDMIENMDGFFNGLSEENQAILESGIDCFYKILKIQVEEDNNEK